MIYIDYKSKKSIIEALSKIDNTNTLTIAENKYFIENNGCINFLKRNERYQFEINRSALENQKLKASANLLKLAVNK